MAAVGPGRLKGEGAPVSHVEPVSRRNIIPPDWMSA